MTRRSLDSRALAEGALLAAIAVVLVLLGNFVPVVGAFLLFAWPLPVVLIFVRHGGRAAVLTVAAATLILVVLLGPLNALMAAIVLGTLGLALGWAQQQQLGAGSSILAASVGMLVSFGLTIAASRFFLREDVLAATGKMLATAAQQVPQIYARIGVPSQGQDQVRQMLTAVRGLLAIALPSVLILAAVVYAFVAFAVMRRVLTRLGYTVPGVSPFAEWRVPPWAIAGWLVGIACLYAYQRTGSPALRDVGFNLEYLFQAVYLVGGLAFAYFLLRHWRVARGLAVGLLVVASLNPLLGQLVVWAGMFESLGNYRRLLRRRWQEGGAT